MIVTKAMEDSRTPDRSKIEKRRKETGFLCFLCLSSMTVFFCYFCWVVFFLIESTKMVMTDIRVMRSMASSKRLSCNVGCICYGFQCL
jgi:ABC-type phosphate transport system permease subunit